MDPQGAGGITAQRLEEKIRIGLEEERKKMKAENARKGVQDAAADDIDKEDYIEITELGGKFRRTVMGRCPRVVLASGHVFGRLRHDDHDR